MPGQTQKITLGMWFTIASTVAALLGLGYSMYSSNVKHREKEAKLEGIVEQLAKSVDRIEGVLLSQGQRVAQNTERLDTTEQVVIETKRDVKETKKELPKLKEAVLVHGRQLSAVAEELRPAPPPPPMVVHAGVPPAPVAVIPKPEPEKAPEKKDPPKLEPKSEPK